jgi:hypothetical protein
MAQEFTINSSAIESKINQLLPSQGGFEPGVDFSASTMVIPIVDLTETAEGSNLRQDLQTSFSLSSTTATFIQNTTTTLINTTGYYRVFGTATHTGSGFIQLQLSDGVTTKVLLQLLGAVGLLDNRLFDFNVFLQAGDSLLGQTNSTDASLQVASRQIADLQGNLVNPI